MNDSQHVMEIGISFNNDIKKKVKLFVCHIWLNAKIIIILIYRVWFDWKPV